MRRCRELGVGDHVALTFHPDWIGGEFPAGSLGRGGAVHGVLGDRVLVFQHELVIVPTISRSSNQRLYLARPSRPGARFVRKGTYCRGRRYWSKEAAACLYSHCNSPSCSVKG